MLVVTDFFVVGLALDATGAWLLVRGLLPAPVPRLDLSLGHPEAVDRMRDRIDATFGFGALLLGFVLQGVGYAVSLATESGGSTGAAEVVAAAALAVVVAAIVLGAHRMFRARLLRRMMVESALTTTGGEWTTASAATLLRFGREAGYPVREGEETKHDYARRVFNVELPPSVQ